MLSKEIIPQTSSDVKSNIKKRKIAVKTHCPSCAKRAIKMLKGKATLIRRCKCPDCGERHILVVYGMTGQGIVNALPDIEFDFVGTVR